MSIAMSDRSQRESRLSPVEELLESCRSWRKLNDERKRLSDRRLRAVVDCVDAGMSRREVANVMSEGEGRHVPAAYVTRMLAWGYPEPEEAS